MSDCTRWAFQQQIDWFRRQFAQHAQLPFSNVLPAQVVVTALSSLGVQFYDSLYNPVTVLWLFLGQVIHANPTLAATVECFLAWRLAQGMSPCSADTGGYARARQRLPEALLAMLTRHTGREADRAAPGQWRWLGRVVKLFDGSTVSMPDTPENQAAFPQSRTQAPGIGFPLARIGVLFSLAVGTVLDLGIRRWAGKFQSELAMLREMIALLDPGDVLLTDRFLCSYMEIALLRGRGVDYAGRMHARRKVDFRRGQRLGPCDHVVQWSKPRRPEWMSAKTYATFPETLSIREFRCRIVRRGYRTRHDRRRHDAVGRGAVSTRRDRRVVPASLGSGVEPSQPEGRHEHGRAPLPDSGDGSQGNLGPSLGVQLDPHGDRPGGGPARKTPAADQLHASHADAGGVPPRDRPRSTRAARHALPADAHGHCFS